MPPDDISGKISDPISRVLLSEDYLALSPLQINQMFATAISDIKKNSKILSEKAGPLHLVSIGSRDGEIQLISRTELMNYKLIVETVEEIRATLLREGVPKSELQYTSKEVERLFEESYLSAVIGFGIYKNTIQQLRDISEISIHVLQDVRQLIYRRMITLREKLVYELDIKKCMLYVLRIATYQSQLRYLDAVIKGRLE